jgi:hypothetical protein
MCKYIVLSYTLCSCKYWLLADRCSKAQGSDSGCPLFPHPTPEKPNEAKEGRCEFCEDDYLELEARSESWFLR